MRLNKIFRVAIFIVALIAVFQSYKPNYRIRSPRLGNPQFLTGTEAFSVVIDGLPPFVSADDIKFNLRSNEILYTLEIKGVKNDVFTVTPESKLFPGAYELSASINGKWFRNPKAVFAYESFPTDFKIAHAADLPDLDHSDGEKLFNALLNDVINEGADILLLTGDIVYHGGADRYLRFYQAISKLDIPIIICPGNHEREDWSLYIADYPDPIHSNLFGDWNIISLDSAHGRDQLSNAQLAWFEKQLIENPDKKTLVQIHHPIVGTRSIMRNQQQFLQLLVDYEVVATLSGHTHVDAFHTISGAEWIADELPPQPWLLTTTTYDFDVAHAPNGGLVFPGYRMLEFENNALVSVGELHQGGRSFMSRRVDLKSKLQ